MKNHSQSKCSFGLFIVGMLLTTTGLLLMAISPTAAQDDMEYMGVRDCA